MTESRRSADGRRLTNHPFDQEANRSSHRVTAKCEEAGTACCKLQEQLRTTVLHCRAVVLNCLDLIEVAQFAPLRRAQSNRDRSCLGSAALMTLSENFVYDPTGYIG